MVSRALRQEVEMMRVVTGVQIEPIVVKCLVSIDASLVTLRVEVEGQICRAEV
jgi:hypothetical protein